MKSRPLRLALFLCITALAIAPASMFAAGVRVLFDPASAQTGPFPADSLTVPDPQQKTGLRVHLPQPDCNAEPSSCAEIDSLNQLDGFSLQPQAAVRFSADVDLHSVETGIYLVWLESVTREERGLHPQGYTTQINQLVYDPSTHTAYFKPNEILEQHRRYLLVVTDDVRDAAGDPVDADPAFTACIAQPAGEYCNRLSAALQTLEDSTHVVGAAVFTTLSATAWLESARRQLQQTPTNFRRLTDPNVISIRTLGSFTLRREVRTDPQTFDDFTVPSPALFLPNLDRVAFGIYQSPDYLAADQTIPETPTGAEATAADKTRDIYFHVLLPRQAPPASGYPVVIFGHGLGDSRFGASTLVGNTLAARGFATVAINAVGHGGGPGGVVLFSEPGGTIQLPLGGRSIDLNHDGTIEGREGCIVSVEPVGVRDCLRQTTVDLMQLVRLIREKPDLDGAAGISLDASRIYYAGQSLGALYGSLLDAIEPDVRAAVLNVGGGSALDIARRSDEFQEFISDFLSTRNPPLMNPGQPFDDNLPLRNLAPLVSGSPRSVEIEAALERAEWRQMPGDPLAYAPHFSRSPLPGLSAKAVLFQIARGDKTVPNPENSALIRAADSLATTQLYRHDLARQVVSNLPENPHTYLVNIENLFGMARTIADAAQQQIAGYFESDGSLIPDVNPLVSSVFHQRIFETPAVLPDNVGEDSGVTTVSAASFLGPDVAPDSIVSGFGPTLAADTLVAQQTPLPTILGDTTVRIIDSEGQFHFGQLIVVSPLQINFLIPAEAALGPAEIVVNGPTMVSRGIVQVAAVAPAIFTADANGKGAPAAVVTSLSGASRTDEIPLGCIGTPGGCPSLPIDLGGEGVQVFLTLFGTGIRGRGGLAEVTATIGGEAVPVLFGGAQGEFAGLDQVNLGPIPRSLAGRGQVDLAVTVSGKQVNPVSVTIR